VADVPSGPSLDSTPHYAIKTVVQQIMKESNSALLEDVKFLAITKIVLNLRIHRPLKV
jgi:hypothetical protein